MKKKIKITKYKIKIKLENNIINYKIIIRYYIIYNIINKKYD